MREDNQPPARVVPPYTIPEMEERVPMTREVAFGYGRKARCTYTSENLDAELARKIPMREWAEIIDSPHRYYEYLPYRTEVERLRDLLLLTYSLDLRGFCWALDALLQDLVKDKVLRPSPVEDAIIRALGSWDPMGHSAWRHIEETADLMQAAKLAGMASDERSWICDIHDLLFEATCCVRLARLYQEEAARGINLLRGGNSDYSRASVHLRALSYAIVNTVLGIQGGQVDEQFSQIPQTKVKETTGKVRDLLLQGWERTSGRVSDAGHTLYYVTCAEPRTVLADNSARGVRQALDTAISEVQSAATGVKWYVRTDDGRLYLADPREGTITPVEATGHPETYPPHAE